MAKCEKRLSLRQPMAVVKIGHVRRLVARIEGLTLFAIGSDVTVKLGRLNRGDEGSVGGRNRNGVWLEVGVATVEALGRQLVVAED